MVTHYIYQVKILNQVEFNACPKYLIYKYLMRQIKRLTCLRTDRVCSTCPFHHQCIYYRLSGENFTMYPAIMVKRQLVEKRFYHDQSSFDIDLFLIGNQAFKGYIESFFENLQKLEDAIIVTVKKSHQVLESKSLFDRSFRIMTPYKETDLTKQMAYYDKHYATLLTYQGMSAMTDKRTVKDVTRYRLDVQTIKLYGTIGQITFQRIDDIIATIGIGQTNFLGGGQLIEIKD